MAVGIRIYINVAFCTLLCMIFIPNFNNKIGKKLILDNKNKFISLMLIFGQLKILQVILKRFQIELNDLEKLEDNYFN